MATGMYVGVGDKAKNIKAAYVGDSNGKARKIVKGYVGVGNPGVARLFFNNAVKIISFSITLDIVGEPTTSYQAEEGMTWGEWVSSSYNTGGYIINSSGYIVDSNETRQIVKGGIEVNQSDLIEADYNYWANKYIDIF